MHTYDKPQNNLAHTVVLSCSIDMHPSGLCLPIPRPTERILPGPVCLMAYAILQLFRKRRGSAHLETQLPQHTQRMRKASPEL